MSSTKLFTDKQKRLTPTSCFCIAENNVFYMLNCNLYVFCNKYLNLKKNSAILMSSTKAFLPKKNALPTPISCFHIAEKKTPHPIAMSSTAPFLGSPPMEDRRCILRVTSPLTSPEGDTTSSPTPASYL